jgi:hypothetical protein
MFVQYKITNKMLNTTSTTKTNQTTKTVYIIEFKQLNKINSIQTIAEVDAVRKFTSYHQCYDDTTRTRKQVKTDIWS